MKSLLFFYSGKAADRMNSLLGNPAAKKSAQTGLLLQNEQQYNRYFSWLQLGVILVFSLAPLLFNLPYRVNIFLSYEGAYRLYLGQMPFRDFGMPLGFGYFVVPALFFKLLGPHLFSLVYAQALINILTLLSLRSILRLLNVKPANVLLSILVMCLSFTFPINFWPWYNNSAFVYGLFGLNMVLLYMFGKRTKQPWLSLLGAGFFMAFALMTKQDYGGLAFVFGLILIAYHSILDKDYKSIFLYGGFYAVFLALFIVPFLPHDFLYWFNYGQAPHDSRLHLMDFMEEILGGSFYEKLYLLLIGLIAYVRFDSIRNLFANKQAGAFLLLSAGMVCMALITKVTSRLPADTSTYFHAFAAAYLLEGLSHRIRTSSFRYLSIIGLLCCFWWSGVLWKYTSKWFNVSKNKEAQQAEASFEWGLSPYKAFERVYLPRETIEGIERIKALPIIEQNNSELKVLNMSELTPLAHELGYTPLTDQPLWYHLNIGMFDQQVQEFNQKVEAEYYDLVLFEDIPSLTEFYPYEVREKLRETYELQDRFLAPRALGDSYVEVYTRKKP